MILLHFDLTKIMNERLLLVRLTEFCLFGKVSELLLYTHRLLDDAGDHRIGKVQIFGSLRHFSHRLPSPSTHRFYSQWFSPLTTLSVTDHRAPRVKPERAGGC